jgi:hypothetical protein
MIILLLLPLIFVTFLYAKKKQIMPIINFSNLPLLVITNFLCWIVVYLIIFFSNTTNVETIYISSVPFFVLSLFYSMSLDYKNKSFSDKLAFRYIFAILGCILSWCFFAISQIKWLAASLFGFSVLFSFIINDLITILFDNQNSILNHWQFLGAAVSSSVLISYLSFYSFFITIPLVYFLYGYMLEKTKHKDLLVIILILINILVFYTVVLKL